MKHLFPYIRSFHSLRKNNVQKVQCVVLTDGEASGIPVVTEFKGHDGEVREVHQMLVTILS